MNGGIKKYAAENDCHNAHLVNKKIETISSFNFEECSKNSEFAIVEYIGTEEVSVEVFKFYSRNLRTLNKLLKKKMEITPFENDEIKIIDIIVMNDGYGDISVVYLFERNEKPIA